MNQMEISEFIAAIQICELDYIFNVLYSITENKLVSELKNLYRLNSNIVTMMHYSMSSITLLLSLWCQGTQAGFVITQAGSSILYVKFLIKSGFQTSGWIPNPDQRFSFCLDLLAARFFRVKEESDYVTKQTYKADANYLIELRNKTYSQSCEPRDFQIIQDFYRMWALKCSAHDPEVKWYATFDVVMNMGLLFEYEYHHTFIGLIDVTTELQGISKTNLRLEFMQSVSRTFPALNEPLCLLKKYSKYRLCSICAEAIAKSEKGYKKTFEETADGVIFSVATNHWHWDRDVEACPQLNITMEEDTENWIMIQTALYCHVTINDDNYVFYLKKNREVGKKNETSVFIIQHDANYSYIMKLKDLVVIPQIRSILDNLN